MTSGSETIWGRRGANSMVKISAAPAGQTAMHRSATNSSCTVARHIASRAEHDTALPAVEPLRRARFPQSEKKRQATMTRATADVLTASEVSRMTGIPVSTLHDWAAKRERGIQSPGPHHCKLSSRHRRWMRSDVVEWLAASRC